MAAPFSSTISPETTFIRSLTLDDTDACVLVENAAFTNPDHRASKEKFDYRLSVCPELNLGVFAKVSTPEEAAALVDGGKLSSEQGGSVLVAHIVATRCDGGVVSDPSMAYPKDWRTTATQSPLGHQPQGATVAIHSLAVVPAAQGKGLGKRIMESYIERQSAASPKVDQVALICQDYLVDYYKKRGYGLVGPSAAQFGGGGWYDMVYNLNTTA